MSLYDGFKDVIGIAQKADNIELYKQLLDLSAEALELQNKINELTQENRKLRQEVETNKTIVRHADGDYITLADDELNIKYCSTCWGKNQKLIQIKENPEVNAIYPKCPICLTEFFAARNGGNRNG